MDPAPLEQNAAVARPPHEIVADGVLDHRHHVRLGRRVQAMAAVVAMHAVELEAPGIAADTALALERQDVGLSAAREKERGTDARRDRRRERARRDAAAARAAKRFRTGEQARL